MTETKQDQPREGTEWTLNVTCPRPRNRAGDDFHLQPDKLTTSARRWFGEDADLTLTARRVRFSISGKGKVWELASMHGRLAYLLHALMLNTQVEPGLFRLPRPVRTEVHEKDVSSEVSW